MAGLIFFQYGRQESSDGCDKAHAQLTGGRLSWPPQLTEKPSPAAATKQRIPAFSELLVFYQCVASMGT